jgi:signal recognition particle subunit SRP68
MDLITAKPNKTAAGGPSILVERLGHYPEGKIDFQNGIVEWPPKVSPVPVKPLFLDVAFNFIEYPGDGAPRAVADAQEKPEGKKGSGFLGSLWGR